MCIRRRIVNAAVNMNGVLRFKNDNGRRKEADDGRTAALIAVLTS